MNTYSEICPRTPKIAYILLYELGLMALARLLDHPLGFCPALWAVIQKLHHLPVIDHDVEVNNLLRLVVNCVLHQLPRFIFGVILSQMFPRISCMPINIFIHLIFDRS